MAKQEKQHRTASISYLDVHYMSVYTSPQLMWRFGWVPTSPSTPTYKVIRQSISILLSFRLVTNLTGRQVENRFCTVLYRFLHLLQARTGGIFSLLKFTCVGESHGAAETGCRPLLSLIAAGPTPNGRHATRVIGRDCQRDAASISLVETWRQH